MSHQVVQLLLQRTPVLFQTLQLLLFTFQVNAQLTDLLMTHGSAHAVSSCTSETLPYIMYHNKNINKTHREKRGTISLILRDSNKPFSLDTEPGPSGC